jgi:hypothetical protein
MQETLQPWIVAMGIGEGGQGLRARNTLNGRKGGGQRRERHGRILPAGPAGAGVCQGGG